MRRSGEVLILKMMGWARRTRRVISRMPKAMQTEDVGHQKKLQKPKKMYDKTAKLGAAVLANLKRL